MPKAKAVTKIKILAISMKGHGPRVCPMERERKPTKKDSRFKEKSCTDKNLDKELITSLTEKYIQAASTITKATAKAKSHIRIKAFMRGVGN